MRVAEGQVRAVMADRAEGPGVDARWSRCRRVEAGDGRHAQDGQARSAGAAAGVLRRLIAPSCPAKVSLFDMRTRPEAWQRGPVPGIPDQLQPVAHALIGAAEDAADA